MNVREMHIEIKQSSQNISANVNRKLLPDEIDWLLNKIQERFIQSKVKSKKDGSGGFQVDQVDTDAIRQLIVSNKVLKHFNGTDDNSFSAHLPADYSYLISDDSKTLQLCNIDTPSVETITESIVVIPFTSGKSSAKYFATAVISLTSTSGVTSITLADLVTLFQVTFDGLNSKTEAYTLRDALLWYIRYVKNIEVYWQNYADVYAPNSFIFVGYSAGSIIVDSQASVAGTVKSVSYSRFQSTSGNWVANRLTSSDKLSSLLVTPFIKPSYKTPISELAGKELNVYGDVGFLVTGVRIDYVRKPRRINLTLGQDCELSEEFHQAICDLTVEYFKAMTADPNWEVKLKDNIARSVVS